MSLLDRILESPAVYRLWQSLAMADRKLDPVSEADIASARRVLDLGCGPGTNAHRFAGAERYVGVDLNPRYVASAGKRHPGRFLVGDAARLDLPGESFDFVLVNSLLHHMDDAAVEAALDGIGALLEEDGRVHVLDLVLPEEPGVARWLARRDRGDHPRSLDAWRDLLGARFETIVFEPYALERVVPLWRMVYFKGRLPRS